MLVLVTGCDSTTVLIGTNSGTVSTNSGPDSLTMTSMSSTWKKLFVININLQVTVSQKSQSKATQSLSDSASVFLTIYVI